MICLYAIKEPHKVGLFLVLLYKLNRKLLGKTIIVEHWQMD